MGDVFGWSIALSSDGDTLAVGAPWEDGAATGVDGDPADNTAKNAGAVYVYGRANGTWSQQAYVKASSPDAGDSFGSSLALSADGDTLAIGAEDESGAAIGIDGDQADNSAPYAGAVYVFRHSKDTWSQEAYVKASNTGSGDSFGGSIALSADGGTLAVGAYQEDGAATGINGIQTGDSAPDAGAVYVFVNANDAWTQHGYVKASNTGVDDYFGGSVALSADSNTLVVGAPIEDSAATGIGGNQADNSSRSAGAVYLY